MKQRKKKQKWHHNGLRSRDWVWVPFARAIRKKDYIVSVIFSCWSNIFIIVFVLSYYTTLRLLSPRVIMNIYWFHVASMDDLIAYRASWSFSKFIHHVNTRNVETLFWIQLAFSRRDCNSGFALNGGFFFIFFAESELILWFVHILWKLIVNFSNYYLNSSN